MFIKPKEEGGCPSTNPCWEHFRSVWPRKNNEPVKFSRKSLKHMNDEMKEDLRQFLLTSKHNLKTTYIVPAKCWMRYFREQGVQIDMHQGGNFIRALRRYLQMDKDCPRKTSAENDREGAKRKSDSRAADMEIEAQTSSHQSNNSGAQPAIPAARSDDFHAPEKRRTLITDQVKQMTEGGTVAGAHKRASIPLNFQDYEESKGPQTFVDADDRQDRGIITIQKVPSPMELRKLVQDNAYKPIIINLCSVGEEIIRRMLVEYGKSEDAANCAYHKYLCKVVDGDYLRDSDGKCVPDPDKAILAMEAYFQSENLIWQQIFGRIHSTQPSQRQVLDVTGTLRQLNC